MAANKAEVVKALTSAANTFKADPSNTSVLDQYSQLLTRAGLPTAALLVAERAFASEATNPTRAAGVTLALIALHRQADAVAHVKSHVIPVVEAQLRGLRAP